MSKTKRIFLRVEEAHYRKLESFARLHGFRSVPSLTSVALSVLCDLVVSGQPTPDRSFIARMFDEYAAADPEPWSSPPPKLKRNRTKSNG